VIIGLTGPSGSHKTVVSKHLGKDYGFERYHAGEPVKRAAQAAHGLSKRQVHGKGKDKPAPQLGGAHPRQMLESMGVAMHRAAPRATANAIHKEVLKHARKGKSVVIDGVRSPEEEAMIRHMGGHMWRMDNGKGSAEKSMMPMDRMQEDVKADSLVDTSGSKDDIKTNVDNLISRHLGIGFSAGAEPTNNKGTVAQGGINSRGTSRS
jgi:hypothetical protein